MKTDQLLTVSFKHGEIRIWHKSKMGSLQDVFALGNAYRHQSGLAAMPLAAWIKRQDVVEYCEHVENVTGEPAIVRKKGKNGGTFARLEVLIDAAMSLSPEFKHEIITMFLENKIHLIRDESGDEYKIMNELLAQNATLVIGRPAEKEDYMKLAMIIKRRCKASSWNTASAYQLKERMRIEGQVSTMLRMEVVKDWDHLIQLAETI